MLVELGCWTYRHCSGRS